VAHYLELAGRSDIPLAAGAGATLSKLARHLSTAEDPRYWPQPIAPAPSAAGAAIALLSENVERGATIVAIGAATNLALLEVVRPGSLQRVSVVFMGGWIQRPAPGLPPWGPEMDWNVQCDPQAALIVGAAANLTLVTLPATLMAHLRASHLPRVRASGQVGELLALQSEVHAQDNHMADLARRHPGLPDDLVNFHYDPVTCAVAQKWAGATVQEMLLQPVLRDGLLQFCPTESGRLTHVVTDVDGEQFAELWLARIETLSGTQAISGRPTGR